MTRESYEPTWEPKDFANEALVEEWEEKQDGDYKE